jgi:hypothetical protein
MTKARVLITARTSLRMHKADLYHYLEDALARLRERPLQDDDTYEVEIKFLDDKASLVVRECTTQTVVMMKIFYQEV